MAWICLCARSPMRVCICWLRCWSAPPGLFGLSRGEWLWITAAIVLVRGAEDFNTALGYLADALHPKQHPGIDRAKDVAAAAVLIAAFGAAVVGMLVFVPHLLLLGQ